MWLYIELEKIPIVPLYLAAKRSVVKRGDTLVMVDDNRFRLEKQEKVQMEWVRFRTLGCYPLSGAIPSRAATVKAIIQEMLTANHSERQGRLIDHDEEASMEIKKREGYF